MKTLVIAAIAAISAALSAVADTDENGWRCEGDCPKDVQCSYCNPPRKRAAKSGAKKARKSSSRKRAEKGASNTPKTPRKRSPRKSRKQSTVKEV